MISSNFSVYQVQNIHETNCMCLVDQPFVTGLTEDYLDAQYS